MAKPDLTRETLPEFAKRIETVDVEAERCWGTMEAPQMLRHLRGAFEISLGEIEVPDWSIPVVRTMVRLMFFEWFTTWPKGKIKAPAEFFPPVENEFEKERALLLATMARFLDEAEQNPGKKTLNPALGKVSLQYWAHIHGLHLDHHLRQFGV
jgi:hypothetical protein